MKAVFDVLDALLGLLLLLEVRGLGGALARRIGRFTDATRGSTIGHGVHERGRSLVRHGARRRSRGRRLRKRRRKSIGVCVVLRSALALNRSV